MFHVKKFPRKLKNNFKTNQSRLHAICLRAGSTKLPGQALGINLASRRQIRVTSNSPNDIKNTFSVATKIKCPFPDYWAGQHPQNGGLQEPLDTTSSHRMEHRILRVVDADQRAFNGRALLKLVSQRLILLLECLQPVLIFVQILVELGRIQNVILHTFLVAVKFNNQVVEDGDATEGRNQISGLSSQVHAIEDLK